MNYCRFIYHIITLNNLNRPFMNKTIFLILSIFIFGLTACKKENLKSTPTPPTANFSLVGYTLNNVILIGTYDQYQLVNSSTNANSYLWDFGNDSIYKQETPPALSYSKSGNYVVKLTAQNANGQKSIITKNVKVLDRVIRQIVIRGLTNFNSPSPQNLTTVNAWGIIKLGQNNANYPLPVTTNTSFNAPIVYQTPVVQNLSSVNLPYTFNVPNKIIFDFPALATLSEPGLGGYKGIGYGLELYAQSNSTTYLLSSSYSYFYSSQSGSISWPVADIEKNIFVVRYGNVDVICDYE